MNAISSIHYSHPGTFAGSFQQSSETPAPFATVIEALRREIGTAGLWVLDEIDPQQVLLRAGHVIGPVRQILFFHPDLVVRLLRTDPCALLEAPLKFVVIELPGGVVSVRWLDPLIAFARYGHPELAYLGKELSLTCRRIVRSALAPALAA
jgi:uncharacterized protein (DUF302 family)